MAYRTGERRQLMLFPKSFEDSISQEDPVRAYDAFVDALDLPALGIPYAPKCVGNSSFLPLIMMKILVYGYSYGFRSSRKLERALHHNVTFMWLAGGLKPDHKTISEFRRRHKKALKKVLKQCARLCIELDLIAGNTLFVDGSKFRANASIGQTRSVASFQEQFAGLDKHIDQLLEECERVDQAEQADASLVKLREDLVQEKKLQAKVNKVLDILKQEERKQINTTDPECVDIHGRQGSHAGYNAQIVVDEQHGMIVHSDVVNDNHDYHQFSNQLDQANAILDSPCTTAVADAGYYTIDELAEIDKQSIAVIVPSQDQASEKTPEAFAKCHFKYIASEDCYLCPAGQRLKKLRYDRHKNADQYAAGRKVCRACKHFGLCTTGRTHGRLISRHRHHAVQEKLRALYQTSRSQQIFSRRKEVVELPFGHLKRNLGVQGFLLRGLSGVRAEMSILCSCFNIARLISLFGVSGLVRKLQAI